MFAGLYAAIKILIVPALIASFLYILLAYLVIPLLRRHRERYSQYAPIESLRTSTSAVRTRILTSTVDFLLFVFKRRTRRVDVHDDEDEDERGSLSGDELAFGEEEGESMVGFDISRQDRSVRGGNVAISSDNRLNRDLEAGFRDDSEEDLTLDDRRLRTS